MRTKLALKNASMSLLLQVVLALSGLIIPRFFIAIYGSRINGLVTSIGQFITCMSLVEAGIGAAGTVALYRPLAERNGKSISAIVSGARKFYLRSGLIFALLCALLVTFYPAAVKKELTDSGFVRIMVLVLCVNGLVDYFYLGKYRVLLMADQRGYVISFAQIIGTLVMTAAVVVLMFAGASALWVKGTAAAVYLARSLAVGVYVKRHYPEVDFRADADLDAFDQRWSALLHQIVGMITLNTDVILLTLLLREDALSEVSVYGTYNLVACALSGLMSSLSSGLTPSFGDVLARDEKVAVSDSFRSYEFLFFMLIFAAYACMAVLLLPFMELYCADFPDRSIYLRWPLVLLFTLAGLFQSLRLPGLTLICGAGHYKQTQGRAIAEAVINLSVSLVLIRPLGIIGVLIGTCVSFLYRSTDVIVYSAKRVLNGTAARSARRIARNLLTSGGMTVLGLLCIAPRIHSWLSWVLWACVFGIAELSAVLLVNGVFEKNEVKSLAARCRGLLKKE